MSLPSYNEMRRCKERTRGVMGMKFAPKGYGESIQQFQQRYTRVLGNVHAGNEKKGGKVRCCKHPSRKGLYSVVRQLGCIFGRFGVSSPTSGGTQGSAKEYLSALLPGR